jgi:ferredoxin-NADP reductase
VKEKREVAKGTLLVTFDLQGEEVDFRPGQYFWVELLDSPYERGVLGLCTRLRDSAFKKTLVELEPGDEVEVEPPKGDWALPEDTSPSYVFVAGGIGITPYHSMLRYIADTGAPYRVTLVYSNRDRESAPFLAELGEYERTLPNFRLVLTMTDEPGWEGETRHIDAEMLRDHLGDLGSHTFLVTGPPPMVESVTEKLTASGVPEGQVLPERFSGY